MNQQGIALLITMILMGTIIATALGVATLVVSQAGIARSRDDSILALFAADAGMEKMSYYANRLNGNPASANFKKVMETGDTSFVACPANKTCYLACTPSQGCDDSTLKSLGEFNTAQRSFEASYQ